MVIGVFPALKLGALFIRQISKPLAKFLVNRAKNHPLFRTYFIIPPAQLYHWSEVKAKMYLMNLGKPTKVAKLNEAMAMELGANLMGEVIIFGVAGGCLMLEYNRQVAKDTKKEEARERRIKQFIAKIEDLHSITLKQEAEIQYLHNAIETLAKHTKHQLPTKPIVPKTIEQNEQVCTGGKCDANMNLKTNMESRNKEDENRSLVQRAIVYYQTDVKADRLS